MREKGFRVEIPVHIKRDRRARKVLAQGETPKAEESVPRMARLLALAHKWEGMVRRGEADYTELARRHGLSDARVSQICSLVMIDPAVQERILAESPSLETVTTVVRLVTRLPVWADHR